MSTAIRESKLTFESDGHRYYYAGVPVPSVTQILEPLKRVMFANVDPGRLQASAEKGTAIHHGTHLIDMDTLDPDTVHPIIQPYLHNWRTFIDEQKFMVCESEKMLFSGLYRFAGTIDKIGYWNNKPAVLDIKTGAGIPMTAGPQLYAYEILAKEAGIYKANENIIRIALHLTADPYHPYTIKLFGDPVDRSVFLSCLQIHQYLQQKGNNHANKY